MELLWTGAATALEFIRPAEDFHAEPTRPSHARVATEVPMLDIAMIAVGFAFLAGAILYVYGCDRL